MFFESLFSCVSSKSQFVLSLGDENAVLVYSVDGKAKNAWLALSDYKKGLESFKEAFAVDTNAPVYVLLDIHEQLYRDEAMPSLNIFDKSKVLDRHLSIIYPGNCLHSYLPMEADKKNSLSGLLKLGNKTNNYLFIGIPMSSLLKGWLEIVDNLPNLFGGIYLLPVESVSMIKALIPRELEKNEKQYWQVLIGYNVAGGIRQVVLKNGYLVMTRLTQMNLEFSSPIDCADEIQRNFNATISYIKRKGYSVDDKLDAVFITSESIGEHIKDSEIETRTVTVMTPEQVGNLLNLGNVSSSEQPFCDMIHAVWFAANSQKSLRFRRNPINEKSLKRITGRFAPYALAILSIITAVLISMSFIKINNENESIANVKQQIIKTTDTLNKDKELLSKQPYSASKIREVMALNEELNFDSKINLVEILEDIEKSLKNEIVVSEISINAALSENNSTRRRRRRQTVANSENVEIVITINLPNDIITPENAVSFSDDIKAQLKKAFADYDVEITHSPVDILSNQTLQGQAGSKTGRSYTDAEYQTTFKISKSKL